MDVLLIVDMQEWTVSADQQHDLQGVVERTNRLAARVRSREGCVVFIQHDGAPGEEFEPFTSGWLVATSMQTDSADRYVRKTLCDSFYGTTLDATLFDLDVTRLLVAGWATEFCVDSTVRSAVSRGFAVVVAADCHTLHDRDHLSAEAVIEHHNWVWANLITRSSIHVVPEREI